MSKNFSIESLADGAIAEQINSSIEKVLENISDPNTPYKTKRKLNIVLVFDADETREMSEVGVTIKPVLAPATELDAVVPRINFNSFIETEAFNVMLQSNFVKNNDIEQLLIVTGSIKDEAVKQVGDDGISQSVTVKTGVATMGAVIVPNPVLLAPYRTFPEVEQPESKFIFRMKSGPSAAIIEADGGAWRNKAMESIKEFLKIKLVKIDNLTIIS